ncbi:MAG: 3-methyl-2-oxobutanoate hydroxymethyltransferase [Immundisolibacteraceae bacterium]|jgi:3-methyl-2-oxobutanoate hydroxymethyltransferase|nr:3-methyl-2-oxobutanoate hydroxymethyltransferase [Immundisolibacteraceae bacterium]
MTKVTAPQLQKMKQQGERISSLTAYDYLFARTLDRAGVDAILVGDSLGMVVQGNSSTLPVTLDEMTYHSLAVSRGVTRSMVITDLPFMSYQQSPQQALLSAGQLMKSGGAEVVKLEGGTEMASTVSFLVERGVPVCGHLGLTPQSVHQLGGYRVQGRDAERAEQLLQDALALQSAGACAVVLECIPQPLAQQITAELAIPTIGIGAGADCDGQVLVLQDMLGLNDAHVPRFVRNFMTGSQSIEMAVKSYVEAVQDGSFPSSDESYA